MRCSDYLPQSYGYKNNRTKNYVTVTNKREGAVVLLVTSPRFFHVPVPKNDLCRIASRKWTILPATCYQLLTTYYYG